MPQAHARLWRLPASASATATATDDHPPAQPPRAFMTLLLVALMFGANHVAARIALDHGVNVGTAVAARRRWRRWTGVFAPC